MKIEDIIEAFNMSLKDIRKKKGINANSFLVIHKSVIPETAFRSYKNFKWEIFCIHNKDKNRILMHKYRDRAVSEQEIQNISNLQEIIVCKKLISWKDTHSYELVLNDTFYGEDSYEYLSD